MNLPEIPLLDMLRQRMSWLGARQNLLGQNVANADIPSYRARDLKPLDFDSLLKRSTAPQQFSTTLAVTNPRHIAIAPRSNQGFTDILSADTDTNPNGNTVSLEQEMMKVSDTQAQYQAAANLYSKAVNLLRTAIGHG